MKRFPKGYPITSQVRQIKKNFPPIIFILTDDPLGVTSLEKRINKVLADKFPDVCVSKIGVCKVKKSVWKKVHAGTAPQGWYQMKESYVRGHVPKFAK
jgi:hypothetical protein